MVMLFMCWAPSLRCPPRAQKNQSLDDFLMLVIIIAPPEQFSSWESGPCRPDSVYLFEVCGVPIPLTTSYQLQYIRGFQRRYLVGTLANFVTTLKDVSWYLTGRRHHHTYLQAHSYCRIPWCFNFPVYTSALACVFISECSLGYPNNSQACVTCVAFIKRPCNKPYSVTYGPPLTLLRTIIWRLACWNPCGIKTRIYPSNSLATMWCVYGFNDLYALTTFRWA